MPLAKGVARKGKRPTLPPMVITSSPEKLELERKDKDKKSKEKRGKIYQSRKVIRIWEMKRHPG